MRAHYAWQRGYLFLYPDPAEARRHYAESLALYREVGDTWGTASALLGLGRAQRAVGAFEEAAAVYTKHPYKHGQLAMLGLAARGLGRPVEAVGRLRSALTETGTFYWFPMQMVALVGFSLLDAGEGRAERAVKLFSLASCYGFVANSIWVQDIVGGTLTAAAAGLPPDALRAARERGAALDLGDTIGELLAGRPG